jgi:hypothetical protein
MAERDAALAIMGGAIGIAGLLLVFAGFLLSRAAAYQTKRGDIFKHLAQLSLVPILAALACAWIATWAAQGGEWSQYHVYACFKLVLALSGIYAIIGLLKA